MKIKLALSAVLAVSVLAACGNNQNSEKKETSAKTEVETVKKTDVLNTRDGMEAKLNDLGIPIYPGAQFSKIGNSNGNCDGGHFISYNVPDFSDASKEKIENFYKDVFKKIEAKGWKYNGFFWSKGKEALFFKQRLAKDYKIHTLNFTYCAE